MTAAPVIVAAVASTVERLLGDAALAAFVYGSVATGGASAGSDIDVFVIVDGEPSAVDRHRVGRAFVELQHALGYTPDPCHPVELFSLARCAAGLRVERVESALRALSEDEMAVDGAAADDLEILRALVTPRLRVIDGPELDRFDANAAANLRSALAAQSPADAARARAVLKIQDTGSGQG